MFIVAILFGLKIVWNIFTPIVLAWRLFFSTTDKTTGISMAPVTEVVLLLVLILLSVFSGGTAWFHRPIQVALWGVVTIVGSYILCAVLGVPLSWLTTEIKKRRITFTTRHRKNRNDGKRKESVIIDCQKLNR
jgi:hypothetical protein